MLDYQNEKDVETLAAAMHEAGREAVARGLVVYKGGPFREWAEITEEAREGRRVQARWILERYEVAPRLRVDA